MPPRGCEHFDFALELEGEISFASARIANDAARPAVHEQARFSTDTTAGGFSTCHRIECSQLVAGVHADRFITWAGQH
jgi:hypothetical protein